MGARRIAGGELAQSMGYDTSVEFHPPDDLHPCRISVLGYDDGMATGYLFVP
jgi:hypothetical protein